MITDDNQRSPMIIDYWSVIILFSLFVQDWGCCCYQFYAETNIRLWHQIMVIHKNNSCPKFWHPWGFLDVGIWLPLFGPMGKMCLFLAALMPIPMTKPMTMTMTVTKRDIPQKFSGCKNVPSTMLGLNVIESIDDIDQISEQCCLSAAMISAISSNLLITVCTHI